MLVYDRPFDRPGPEQRDTPRRQSGLDLFQLAVLLWDRKAAIAGAALIVACAAVAIGKSVPARYTATSELYVDPRELQLVDREITPRAQDVSGLSMVVESEARLITSNSVLLRVIADAHLDDDPEFGGDVSGPLASLLRLVGLAPRPAATSQPDQTAALEALNRHIAVRKTERSFIVDVEVWSIDPAKAAALANGVANAYLAELRSTQATAARRATRELSGRLKELQNRLRNAEDALAAYKAQNNFVGTQDTLLSDQQLSASNQRLAAAHAATLDAQARYDQIQASRRTSADPGAIAEALQSPTIANLRSQYADARKRYAELTTELGPLHPALKQMEQQVVDLRRTIGEEIDRVEQSAKNDLTRARDYEASLGRALDAQKRQSVRLSQASVRLRELEREVDASRDVYQAFLKRSRETEEQESLNTSAARIVGAATMPLRRSFPPAMTTIALLACLFGALAAAGFIVAVDRLPRPEARKPEPGDSATAATDTDVADAPALRPEPELTPPAAPVVVEKPAIARLQDSDVIRTLGGILGDTSSVDVTRFGWPTLRPGAPLVDFAGAAHDIRAIVSRRSEGRTPVIAVIGAGEAEDRAIAALNFAYAAARDGSRVLLIDADHEARPLSGKVERLAGREPSRPRWLSTAGTASPAITTANGISILPAAGRGTKSIDAVRQALTQMRSTNSHDLAVLDGPALPWSDADRSLIDQADGLVAVLPADLDINDSMEAIIDALGTAQQKLAGVILNELSPSSMRHQSRQYA